MSTPGRSAASTATATSPRRRRRCVVGAAGSRFSELERLRTSPAKVTGSELERALMRVSDVRQIGVGGLDLSALPENRVLALARYGVSAKAPTLRQLAEPRRTATLVATITHLEQKAIDDALDL